MVKMSVKLGLHSDIFPKDFTVIQKLEHTAKTGHKAIEFEIGPYDSFLYKPLRSIVPRFLGKMERREIRETADGLNVKIKSLCYGLYASPYYNLVDPNPKYRELAFDQIHDTMNLANDLLSDLILILIVDIPGASPKMRKRLLKDSILRLDRLSQDAGITIALEPLAPSFFLNWKQVLPFLEGVGSNVSCYFDIGNTAAMGLSFEDEIMNLGNKIAQIHAKECQGDPRLDLGIVNWDAFFQVLREIRYDGYIIIELPSDPVDPDKVAYKSRIFFSKYV